MQIVLNKSEHSTFKTRRTITLDCDRTIKISVSGRLPEGAECRLRSQMISAPVRSKYSIKRNFLFDPCSTQIITLILLADWHIFLYVCSENLVSHQENIPDTGALLARGRSRWQAQGGTHPDVCRGCVRSFKRKLLSSTFVLVLITLAILTFQSANGTIAWLLKWKLSTSSMLYKAILTFKSVDKILVCDHSNESYWAVLSCGTVYNAVQGDSAFQFVFNHSTESSREAVSSDTV